MIDDDGVAIAYDVLRPGTPVVDSDGAQVGTVHEVLDNKREHIFDGIVIATEVGLRFVDAPEVGRITERRVTLSIDSAAAAALPEPETAAPEYQARAARGPMGRLFGPWRRKR